MNEVRQQKFGATRQDAIKDLVRSIKTRTGGNTRSPRNFSNFRFHTTEPQHQDPELERLFYLLTKDLPKNIRDKAQNARLYLRYHSGNPSAYALKQKLHRNVISNPIEGEAFLQFLYYLDTPKIGNVNAPPNQRGSLILHPSPNKVYTFIPEQGRIVFFNPAVTWHEVSAPVGNLAGNLNRNMIIGFLFKSTNNPTPVNKQNRANSPNAAAVRALAAASRNEILHILQRRRAATSKITRTRKRPSISQRLKNARAASVAAATRRRNNMNTNNMNTSSPGATRRRNNSPGASH